MNWGRVSKSRRHVSHLCPKIVVCLTLCPVFVLFVEGYSAEEERGQDRGIVVGREDSFDEELRYISLLI